MKEGNLTEEKIRKILKKAIQLGYRKEMGLLEAAYKLGYEVGYHGHMEGTGWVMEAYEKLIEKSRKYRMGRIIRYLYEKGRGEGIEASKRKGLYAYREEGENTKKGRPREGTPVYTAIPGIVKTFGPIYSMFGETKPSYAVFFKALRK